MCSHPTELNYFTFLKSSSSRYRVSLDTWFLGLFLQIKYQFISSLIWTCNILNRYETAVSVNCLIVHLVSITFASWLSRCSPQDMDCIFSAIDFVSVQLIVLAHETFRTVECRHEKAVFHFSFNYGSLASPGDYAKINPMKYTRLVDPSLFFWTSGRRLFQTSQQLNNTGIDEWFQSYQESNSFEFN